MKVKLDYLSFTSSVADPRMRIRIQPVKYVRNWIRPSRVNTWSNFETEILINFSIFRNFVYTFSTIFG